MSTKVIDIKMKVKYGLPYWGQIFEIAKLAKISIFVKSFNFLTGIWPCPSNYLSLINIKKLTSIKTCFQTVNNDFILCLSWKQREGSLDKMTAEPWLTFLELVRLKLNSQRNKISLFCNFRYFRNGDFENFSVKNPQFDQKINIFGQKIHIFDQKLTFSTKKSTFLTSKISRSPIRMEFFPKFFRGWKIEFFQNEHRTNFRKIYFFWQINLSLANHFIIKNFKNGVPIGIFSLKYLRNLFWDEPTREYPAERLYVM